MIEKQAVGAFAALAHENRLTIFKALMRAGASGMAAGDIAAHAGLAPSNVSFHVAQMERAGLLRSWRVRRNIFYAVEIDGVGSRTRPGLVRRKGSTDDCAKVRPSTDPIWTEGGGR